jgi:hypothetical protein
MIVAMLSSHLEVNVGARMQPATEHEYAFTHIGAADAMSIWR